MCRTGKGEEIRDGYMPYKEIMFSGKGILYRQAAHGSSNEDHCEVCFRQLRASSHV
jgi:hypothetical protein